MKFVKTVLAVSIGLMSVYAGNAMADALADIQKAGVVRIGVPQDFAPYGSIDSSMQLQGLDIDVARLVGKGLGVKVELVPVPISSRMAFLQTKKIDMIISTLGKNAEREKVLDFSQGYAPYNNSVFGIASIKVAGPADLANQTVGVARSTFEDLMLTDSVPKSTVIKRYEDNNSLIAAYVSGQVQIVGTGDFVAISLAEKLPTSKPVLKYVINVSTCYVGMNKGEPALVAKVNDAITVVKKNGELNKIVQKWLNVPLSEKIATTYQ
ncbi:MULTISPECIES: transporter substrate-binding domain-containing protein [unclassified Herbaspirillum]|uniref:transporter substrate-binding domain-containing protein n=1 Tax=unclassified Herbaspirillum TaxID=2624150 RepID=UPI00026F4B3D|nr:MULTISPECIES: transporter substrate-binding domain-containing protein [unclassified Herbaspirillum]EJM95585.1 periplasmic component of amino acid ABC-type transporter/signal transduction system [Herbaspirillum sp. YR522]MCA1325562.1 transporter substrate-binding domain-containing protein [Herbaspirillum sp. alder98]